MAVDVLVGNTCWMGYAFDRLGFSQFEQLCAALFELEGGIHGARGRRGGRVSHSVERHASCPSGDVTPGAGAGAGAVRLDAIRTEQGCWMLLLAWPSGGRGPDSGRLVRACGKR